LTALAAYADQSQQLWARRFLLGLSADELQFIAEFLGASILDPAEPRRPSRAEMAERIEKFQRSRRPSRKVRRTPSRDEEHKMILLLEYLCRGAVRNAPAPFGFAHA
jgi:hypothetical protein